MVILVGVESVKTACSIIEKITDLSLAMHFYKINTEHLIIQTPVTIPIQR